MMVHCRDINFEPRVGDGIEGVVHRRAKDNKLQAYKVFSYYYYSFLQPSFSIRYDGRAFLNRRGEQSGETGRAAGRGLDPQVAPRYRVSLPGNEQSSTVWLGVTPSREKSLRSPPTLLPKPSFFPAAHPGSNPAGLCSRRGFAPWGTVVAVASACGRAPRTDSRASAKYMRVCATMKRGLQMLWHEARPPSARRGLTAVG